MTASPRPDGVAPSGRADEQAPTSATAPTPVLLQLGPDAIGVLHRSIPVLLDRVRRQLASRPDDTSREVVLDLSSTPPMPTVAPLLFLVRLLRRVVGPSGKIGVIGVTPALAAAVTAYDLPDKVTLVTTRGRRWPA